MHHTLLSAEHAVGEVRPMTRALDVTAARELAVDVSVTAVTGTAPSMTLYIERQADDGAWFPIWTSTVITAPGQVSASIGPGLAVAAALGKTVRLRWTIAGAGASFTFSGGLQAV